MLKQAASFVAAMAIVFSAPSASWAQIGGPYLNNTATVYGGNSPCGAPITTEINVPDSFVIGDLNVRLLAAHVWRTDTNVSIESPSGTVVELLNGPFGANLDNYNVLFDDDNGPVADTGTHAVNQTLTGPIVTVRPEGGPLSDFNGEDAAGIWTFSICDVFPGADDGTILSLELFFTESLPMVASKTVSVIATNSADAASCATATDPADNSQYSVPGSCIQYQISVTNPASSLPAEGISLIDILPNNLTFAGASQSVFTGGTVSTTPASCTSATPSCNVQLNGANLAAGATGTLTIRALVE